jgi:DNA-binding CsgD family transcriptional regulator
VTRSLPARSTRRLGGNPSADEFLRYLADHQNTPLTAGILGPGGTGKSEVLEAAASAYERAGVPVLRHGPGGPPLERDPGDRPLLVDDAHRLEPGELRTLRAIAESGRCCLVLTYRPWPHTGALQAVLAGSAAERAVLVLSHLDRDGVAARVATRFGMPAPDSMVELVHEQSGGLPLLVDVIAQALCDAGRFDLRRPKEFRHPGRVTVSRALAERMRHHVDDLEPAQRALLEAMAIGAPLDADLLRLLLADDRATASALVETVESVMATGLLTDTGVLIPFVRSLLLRVTPLLRTRTLRRRLAEIELERGGSTLAAGRALLGTGTSGARVAAVFAAAADEALAKSPTEASELLHAAVDAGLAASSVAGRRAYAAALSGDLDQALRLADQVITDPDAPDRDRAVAAAATALSHRGLLSSSAELHRFLPPATAVLAAPVLIGTGALADAQVLIAAATRASGPSTLLAGAAKLMARGMVAAVSGAAPAALAQLARAAVLLEPVSASTLLPDTPAALAALVAIQSGEFSVAETALRRAAVGRHGGRAALPRHRLLHAWVGMCRGRLDRARRLLDRIDGHLEPRDELLAAALAVGLARRNNDNAALAAAWQRARGALVEHPIDLYSLPFLGECAVAAARLGEQRWLAAHLDEADALLHTLGRPALWTATTQWYRLHAAVALEDTAGAQGHATELAATAATGTTSTYHAVLATAAACWSDVVSGSVDAAVVQTAARRLHGAGLVWEAVHLAGQAGTRAPDRRTAVALQACARALLNPSTTGRTPAPPADLADTASDGDPEAAPAARRGIGADTTDNVIAEGPVPVLSGRELEIGTLVLAGLTYKQIGEQLFISAKTVEHHVARIRGRLGVTSRNELFGRLRSLV